MNIKDKILIDEGLFTGLEIKEMRKRNKKGCIYHGNKNILDCYHCNP